MSATSDAVTCVKRQPKVLILLIVGGNVGKEEIGVPMRETSRSFVLINGGMYVTFGTLFMDNTVRFDQGRDCCIMALVMPAQLLRSSVDKLVGKGVGNDVIPEEVNIKISTELGRGGNDNKLGVLPAIRSTSVVFIRDGNFVTNVLLM